MTFLRLIHDLKREAPRRRLAIQDGDGTTIGQIVAIGEDDWRDDLLVARIMDWRQDHRDAFMTRIAAPTPDRTRHYLRDIAFAGHNRILFRLLDQQGDTVGHFGLAAIGRHEADVDNLMRGSAALPGFFRQAGITILRFVFVHSQIGRIGADVLDTNIASRRLHLKLGFTASGATALDRQVLPNGDEHFRPALDPARPTSPVRSLRFAISRAAFLDMHGPAPHPPAGRPS